MSNTDKAESFLPVLGYESLYEVSDKGRVRSLKYSEPVELKQFDRMKGYPGVSLRNDDGPKIFLVHRLVALAFVANPSEKPQVNHIDGNKQNNSATNLEWVTPGENMQHAFVTGLCKTGARMSQTLNSLTEEDVRDIRMFYKAGIMPSKIVRVYPVSKQTIANIVRGRTWKTA